MDKPFIVIISGQVVNHCKTLDQARQALKDTLTARKKVSSGVIYQAVETIEPVNFVTDWKIKQINPNQPQPEAGYQPEGFAALKNGGDNSYGHGSSNAADAGPSGFGKDFGTSLE